MRRRTRGVPSFDMRLESHSRRGTTRVATATPEGWEERRVASDAVATEAPPRAPERRVVRFSWAWPAVLVLVLSGYQLTRPALWADELATWGAVRLGWGPLLRLLGEVDAVVAPYFALMKAWTSVAGTSTLALRLPSVLAMAAAAGLLSILGARVAGRPAGLLAGLAFAVVPTTSRYAQEARPYAFAILFAVLASLALVWLLDRPGWPRAALYAVAVAGLGAFHLISVLLLVALGLLAVSRQPPAVLAAAWAVAPILALYLVSQLTTLFWARYLLFTLPGFVLLAALALGRLGWPRAAALLVALALLAAPAQTAIRTPDGHNHATAAAAGVIAANERAGDGIAYALDEPVVPWEARDIVARYVPADKRPRDVFALAPQRTGGRLTATECPDLAACLGDPPRLWVLRYQNLSDPLSGIGTAKEELLRSRYRLEKLWLLRGLTVALYVRG